MAPPDLNSLPPSRSMSASSPNHSRVPPPNRHDSPSPRPSSTSLAAAATINAADLSRRSSVTNIHNSPRLGRADERRRSNVAMTLNLNDPTTPSPGELSSSDYRTSLHHSYSSVSPSTIGGMRTLSNGDPHHQRTPSLGELHQELEQEQEAQVNRMLQMIRQQQQQLDQMQRSAPDAHSRHHSGSVSGAVVDDLTPASEHPPSVPASSSNVLPRTNSRSRYSRGPASASPSPLLRPLHGHDVGHSSSADMPPSPIDIARRNSLRDESTYFQAETASLTRENQMLRLRIRELERQVSEINSTPTQANTPPVSSNLSTSPPIEGHAVDFSVSPEEEKTS